MLVYQRVIMCFHFFHFHKLEKVCAFAADAN